MVYLSWSLFLINIFSECFEGLSQENCPTKDSFTCFIPFFFSFCLSCPFSNQLCYSPKKQTLFLEPQNFSLICELFYMCFSCLSGRIVVFFVGVHLLWIYALIEWPELLKSLMSRERDVSVFLQYCVTHRHLWSSQKRDLTSSPVLHFICHNFQTFFTLPLSSREMVNLSSWRWIWTPSCFCLMLGVMLYKKILNERVRINSANKL